MKITREDKIEIFENSMSWIVVFAMFIYGGAKLIQFDGATLINKKVSEMTGMELMWAFYGFSKPYVLILGALEMMGGILILIRKTRVIGCIFTSTILVNVILQDIFYDINEGALTAAIIYQFLILIILWLNKDKVLKGLKGLIVRSQNDPSKKKLFVKLGIAFILFILLRIVEYYITRAI